MDRPPAERDRLSAAKQYGLVPYDRIQRFFHVMPCDIGVQVMACIVIRIKEIQ